MTNPTNYGYPAANGLYDPANEHDSCGVGFIANIKGERSHQIVEDACEMLTRMEHRGACGCETNTGDGAGIMTALPIDFFRQIAKDECNVELPDDGRFAAGNVFLPDDQTQREQCRQIFERIVGEQGQQVLAWRSVPVDAEAADIGPSARACQPAIEQVFIAAGDDTIDRLAFERELFLIRKRVSREIREGDQSQALMFYVCSLSTKLIVYKGMLSTHQLAPFYLDLSNPDYRSHLAMVHSRFSTNTFPSWDRAQPLRTMSHNGEINTLRGNRNWVFARQGMMSSELFGEELSKAFPICENHNSDSGNFDNALELLLLAGRPLPEAVMMMIPEAWQNHHSMPESKRAFYEYYSALQEPWDGPASMSFTDGRYIGAVLDRNGLRPSRYYITKDDRVIMASEVGVVDVEPQDVAYKGRLQPGKMFLVNFDEGRIIADEELKESVATSRPFKQWLENQRLTLDELPRKETVSDFSNDELLS